MNHLSLGDLIRRIDESGTGGEAQWAIDGGHLLCCTSRGSLPCQWCDWAVVTQSVVDLVTLLDDTRLLLKESPSALWWPLVAWTLQEPITPTGSTSENDIRPEVDAIWRGLMKAVLLSQAELSRVLAIAADSDGQLAKCCSRAAAIAIVSLIEDETWLWSRFVPVDLRERSGAAFQRVDAARLERICTAEIEKLVGRPVVILESERVAESLAKRRQRSRSYIFENIERGSIDELNLESSLRGLVAQIHSIASAVEQVPGNVLVRRAEDPIRLSKLMRKTLWTTCSIDWVQSFIDITGAPCWRACEFGSLRVPWFVAAATEASHTSGRISAVAG